MNYRTKRASREFIQAITVFVIFCGLSLLSQLAYSVFGVVVILGVAFPLFWGKRTGKLAEIGFTRRNIKSVWVWGVTGGILTSIIGILVLPELSIPPQIVMQLAIGIPIWVFIISPFQEIFFRGWLQTRFENMIGDFWGLLLANICFTAWHYFSPFVNQTIVPLLTVVGVLSTFGAGLVYAYIFQRTRNIITPWLAHTLTGITFIIVGAMDFIQAMN